MGIKLPANNHRDKSRCFSEMPSLDSAWKLQGATKKFLVDGDIGQLSLSYGVLLISTRYRKRGKSQYDNICHAFVLSREMKIFCGV